MASFRTDLIQALKATDWTGIEELQKQIKQLRTMGRTLFVGGNGGSHAVSIHWAVDLIKVANVETHALGTNQALHTALSNDIDFAAAYASELVMRAQPGDMLVLLSCSGRSRNILVAIDKAKKLNMPVYMITGTNAPEYRDVETIRINSSDYGVLEDCFSIIGHSFTRELA